MSGTELIVILGGVFIGYFIVSRLMSRTPRAPPPDEDFFAQAPVDAEPASWNSILGVAPNASTQEIRQAYKVRMSEYQAGKVAGLGVELSALAERKTREITAAYQQALRDRNAVE